MNAADIRAVFTYDPATGVIERIDQSRKRRDHTGTRNQRKDTALLISAYSQWKRGEITTAQLGQTVAVAWVAIGFGSALLGDVARCAGR